jgi:predicted choloylglycine hydrolase
VIDDTLVRNYDYAAHLCEGTIWKSAWSGTQVIAMSDCLWGALDGVNEHGLAVSLAFGGRPVVGPGFGVPLVLRHILERCRSVDEGAQVLERIPIHMTYNVTLLDRTGAHRTVHVAPDRPAVVRRWPAATNHQGTSEDWPEYAAATGTHEREQFLLQHLADPLESPERLIARFGEPPLFWPNYQLGWGTLYTAIYRVRKVEVEYRWRDASWHRSLSHFPEEQRRVTYD